MRVEETRAGILAGNILEVSGFVQDLRGVVRHR